MTLSMILMIVGGLIGLAVGGELLVRGAVGIALKAGMSHLVTGVVVIGAATSMPELVASVQAAIAGSPDIAWGNIAGSNIANSLLILGAMLAILAAYIYWRVKHPSKAHDYEEEEEDAPDNIWAAIVLFSLGVGALVLGGKYLGGATMAITPAPIPYELFDLEWPVLAATAVMLLVLCQYANKIGRGLGALLLIAFAANTAILFA